MHKFFVRYNVFMVVKIQVKVFWIVMPCSVQRSMPSPSSAGTSETLVSYHNTTWHHNQEDLYLYMVFVH